MKEIIIGTTNEAKVKQIRGALAPLALAVRGIDKKTALPHIDEDGKTALENAIKKALAYAKALNMTVLSMDNALYFDELAPNEQPGLHVRRIPTDSERPSDDEMLRYYAALVSRFGERTSGRWEFGVCIASPDGKYETTTILSPRIFTNIPSASIVPGYPLESMQIDPETGKYISEMSQEEQDVFWQRAIGKPLQEFVKNIAL